MTKINLHNWQQQTMQNWVKNKGQGYVEAPTGAGKTYLGLKLIEKESLSPFLVVVPTLELKEQWKQRIKKYFPDADVQGIGGGEKYVGFVNTLEPTSRKVIVAIINSVRQKHLEVKTVILDEIHHYTQLAKVNYQVWNNIKYKYVMGLSASPIPDRLSEKDSGWNIPLVFQYTLSDAYRDNVLLQPVIKMKGVELEECELKEYNELTERIKDFGSFSTFQNTPPWFKRIVGMRNDILFDSKKKLDVLKESLSVNSFKKAIVFTERIDTAEEISEDIVQGLGIECLCLHSKVKKEIRREVVDRFINTNFPIVLTTAHLFEEGMDIPEVDLVILYSYNSTRRQAIQRIGRALHNHTDVPKIFILYYDDTKEFFNAKKIRGLFE